MNTQRQITDLLERKVRALINRSAVDLAAVLDDGFIYINSRGKKSSKAEYIALCTVGDLKFQKQQIENLEIHDFGEFAVATMILRDQFVFAGQPYEGVFRSFCAFRKIDGSWRWLGGQTSAE